MIKQEYKEQIIKNLDKADKETLKIIDSVLKPLVDQPSGVLTAADRLMGSIVHSIFIHHLKDKPLLWLSKFVEQYCRNWGTKL